MAATTTKATKRKATESTEQMLKKVKVAKSAERPQPTKSALKKANADPKPATAAAEKPKRVASSKPTASEKSTKPARTQKAAKSKKEDVKSETAAEKIQATKNAVVEAATAKAKSAKQTAKKETAAIAETAKDTAEDTIAVAKGTKKDKTSKVKAAKETEVEDELVDSDDEEAGSALTADQTAALMAGFSSSDEESDDEEGIALSKLPKAPVDKSQALTAAGAASSKTQHDPETTPGIVYVGRLPHGFYERQMRAYFSQFGDITHLRLGRNKKTARSMHYAFIEFQSSAVADIVAKSMDKYLMFNQILQVRRVPDEHVKKDIWRGEGRPAKASRRNRTEGHKLARGATKEKWEKRIERETEKRKSTAAKLAEIGYEFVAPVLKALGQGSATATPDKQLEQDLQQAVEDVEEEKPAKNASNSSKKRAAAAAPEAKKAKKSKAKA